MRIRPIFRKYHVIHEGPCESGQSPRHAFRARNARRHKNRVPISVVTGGVRNPPQATKASSSRARGARSRSRGQALVEFSIVAPILFFFLLGVLESGLLLFVVGTARFGAGEVARQESESGNASNADQVSIAVLRGTAIGTTALATINEVDVYRLIEQGNGSLTVDPAHYNKYRLDGSVIGAISWPPSTRNVVNGQSDFLGITIVYQYNWKTGIFLASHPLQLQQTFEIRLEPQTY
jgi:Flp pilus assembly protein TadG